MFVDATLNHTNPSNIPVKNTHDHSSKGTLKNVKQIDVSENTPWNKREKDVHALGIALLVLGILAAAATVALAFFLTATPIVIIAAVAVSAVVATAMTIAGICLVAKSQFWDDPAYREKQKENLIKDVKESNLSYPELQNKYRTEIHQHKLLSNEDYDDIYTQDVIQLDYPTFKKRHSEELIEKLSDNNQHKLLNSYLQHLAKDEEEWSYAAVTTSSDWRLLGKQNVQHLKPLLLNHARQMDYASFRARHGERVLPIISAETADILAPKYFQELGATPWSYTVACLSPEWPVFVQKNPQLLNNLLHNDAQTLSYAAFVKRHGSLVLNALPANTTAVLAPKYFNELAQGAWSYSDVKKSSEWPLFIQNNPQQLDHLLLQDAQKLSYNAFIKRHGKEVLGALNKDIIKALAPKYLHELGQEAWSYDHVRQSSEWSLFVAENEKQLNSLLHKDAESMTYDAFIKRHGVKVLSDLSSETVKVLAPKYLEDLKKKKDWNYGELLATAAWKLLRPSDEQFHQLVKAIIPGLSFQDFSRMGLFDYLQNSKLSEMQKTEIKALVQPKFLEHIATLNQGVLDVLANYKSTITTLDVALPKVVNLSIKRQIEALRKGVISYPQLRETNSFDGLKLMLETNPSLKSDFREAYLRMGHIDMATPKFEDDRTLLELYVPDMLNALERDAATMKYFAYKAKHSLASLQNEFLAVDKWSPTWKKDLYDFLDDQSAEVVFRHEEDLNLFGETALSYLSKRWQNIPISKIILSADKDAYIKYFLGTPEGRAVAAASLLLEADEQGWQVKKLLGFADLWQLNVLTPNSKFADGRTIQERLDEEIRSLPKLSQIVEQYSKADDYKMLTNASPHVRKLVLDLHKKHALQALPAQEEKLLAKYPYFVPAQLPELVRTGKEKLQEIHARSAKVLEHTTVTSNLHKEKLNEELSQSINALKSRLNKYQQEKLKEEQQNKTLKRKLSEAKESLTPAQAQLQTLRQVPAKIENLRIKLENARASDEQLRRRAGIELPRFDQECRQLEAQLRQVQQSFELRAATAAAHSAQHNDRSAVIRERLVVAMRQLQELNAQLNALRPPIVTGLQAAIHALPAEQEYHRQRGLIMQQIREAQGTKTSLEAQLSSARTIKVEVLSSRLESEKEPIAQRLRQVQQQQKQLNSLLTSSSAELSICSKAYEAAVQEGNQATRTMVALERTIAQTIFVIDQLEKEVQAAKQRLSLATQQLNQQEVEVERAIAQRKQSYETALAEAERAFLLDCKKLEVDTQQAAAETIGHFTDSCEKLY